MATTVHMEALSPTMEEGQLVKWLKSEGDEVEEGDGLAEIETDKATMELVARRAGVLRKQLLSEGGTAPVGAVIGVIAAPDEDIAELLKEAPAAEEREEREEEVTAAAAEGEEEEEEEKEELAAEAAERAPLGKAERKEAAVAPEAAAARPARRPAPEAERVAARAAAAPAKVPKPDGRVKVSPLAKRLAAEAGLELEQVRGTGPGGRITRRDIEAAVRPAVEARREAPPAVPPEERPEVEELPVSQMRKTIAKRLVTSIGPVPTFYLTVEVEVARLLEARQRLNERLE
ncbi:MAG: E3 binding domain-containing protein, partial [Gemmatimonadetes bacterium]|nr:E3 binding domain-containing protein [Gemmatimonadota bacterium]